MLNSVELSFKSLQNQTGQVLLRRIFKNQSSHMLITLGGGTMEKSKVFFSFLFKNQTNDICKLTSRPIHVLQIFCFVSVIIRVSIYLVDTGFIILKKKHLELIFCTFFYLNL